MSRHRFQGMFAVLLTVLCAVLLSVSSAYAQATVAGTVRDASGGVLPGVTVEASSPVLIEKVRTVVTDGNGGYRIVDLRPGSYTVTFTLPGFATFRREGLELSGSITAQVNAELRVGALEETVTVTGAAPIVDVQSTTRQQVMTSEIVDAIPTGRSFVTLGTLLPGVSANIADVGGSQGDVMASLAAHGGKTNDQRILQARFFKISAQIDF